uniref:Uncharacterized protein n=1 Tax=Anguilla anguilla TaxID=7936 RepID=A0A0E9WZF3_ANGAN
MGDIHGHKTRASIAILGLPLYGTAVGRCTLQCSGASEWNKLTLGIKYTPNSESFTQKVRPVASKSASVIGWKQK